jgi:hypothetical protein
MGEFQESAVGARSDSRSFHVFLSGLELDDQLTGFLIKALLKFVYSVREFLYRLARVRQSFGAVPLLQAR